MERGRVRLIARCSICPIALRYHWGSRLLAQIKARSRLKKRTPGQKSLWEEWNAPAEELRQVAKKFVLANCLNPDVVRLRFEPP